MCQPCLHREENLWHKLEYKFHMTAHCLRLVPLLIPHRIVDKLSGVGFVTRDYGALTADPSVFLFSTRTALVADNFQKK